MKLKLSTYSDGQQLPAHHFFILNKGLNSGKPADTPWCNCFIAQFESLEERDQCYWLCYGLWITGKFKYCLSGTAIVFLRKDDISNLLELAEIGIADRKDLYLQSVYLLYEAQQHTQRLSRKLSDLQKAKVEILRHFVRI